MELVLLMGLLGAGLAMAMGGSDDSDDIADAPESEDNPTETPAETDTGILVTAADVLELEEGEIISFTEGNDTVDLPAYGTTPSIATDFGAGDDVVTLYSAGDMNLGDGDDSLTVESFTGGEIQAGAGNDTLTGDGGYSATVHGNDGDDVITTRAFPGAVYGDDGNDTISVWGETYDERFFVYGGAGDDVINADIELQEASFDDKSPLLYGGDGADTFTLRLIDNVIQEEHATGDDIGFGAPVLDYDSSEDRITLELPSSFLVNHAVPDDYWNDTVDGVPYAVSPTGEYIELTDFDGTYTVKDISDFSVEVENIASSSGGYSLVTVYLDPEDIPNLDRPVAKFSVKGTGDFLAASLEIKLYELAA